MGVHFQALIFFMILPMKKIPSVLVLRKDYIYINTITTFESKAKHRVDGTTHTCAKYNSEWSNQETHKTDTVS